MQHPSSDDHRLLGHNSIRCPMVGDTRVSHPGHSLPRGYPSGSALDLRLPAAPEYHIPGGREAAPTQLSTAIRGLPTRAFVLYGIPRQDRNRSSLPARKPSFDTRTVPRGARGRLAAHSFFLPEDAPWTRRRRLLPSLRNSSPHRPLIVLGRESLPGLRPSVVQEPYEPASID